MEYLVFGFRLVLAVLLFAAAVTKWSYPLEGYEKVLDSYRVIPKSWYWVAARLAPVVESFIAIGLFIGLYPRAFAVASVVLLLGYTGLVVAAISRGVSADCNCFGVPQQIGWSVVWRNLILVALALVISVFGSQFLAIESVVSSLENRLLLLAEMLIVPVISNPMVAYSRYLIAQSKEIASVEGRTD